jgi:hypothetical protein
MQRGRFQNILSFPDRLNQEAQRLREEAKKLPQGIEREMFLREARRTEAAAHMDEWLSSPGLQAPR